MDKVSLSYNDFVDCMYAVRLKIEGLKKDKSQFIQDASTYGFDLYVSGSYDVLKNYDICILRNEELLKRLEEVNRHG